MFSWIGGRQKDSTTTFLDGILARTKSIFFSFFTLFFIFSIFLFILLKVSPKFFSDNFPVIQATLQSNSKRCSQIVNIAVK